MKRKSRSLTALVAVSMLILTGCGTAGHHTLNSTKTHSNNTVGPSNVVSAGDSSSGTHNSTSTNTSVPTAPLISVADTKRLTSEESSLGEHQNFSVSGISGDNRTLVVTIKGPNDSNVFSRMGQALAAETVVDLNKAPMVSVNYMVGSTLYATLQIDTKTLVGYTRNEIPESTFQSHLKVWTADGQGNANNSTSSPGNLTFGDGTANETVANSSVPQ